MKARMPRPPSQSEKNRRKTRDSQRKVEKPCRMLARRAPQAPWAQRRAALPAAAPTGRHRLLSSAKGADTRLMGCCRPDASSVADMSDHPASSDQAVAMPEHLRVIAGRTWYRGLLAKADIGSDA
ncbi:hypothetical protein RSP03_33220 [Cereibacter sphaeroides]|nr:hypothetical protein RSP03_33220 [Cereibacter sphaeroides]